MNPLVLHMLGKQAADAFVSSDIPLNTTIAKLASDHGLSPVQIQRVVEIANHDANDRLRAAAADKTFAFKVASVDAVLGELKGASSQSVPLVDTLNVISTLGKTAADSKLVTKIASVGSEYHDKVLEKQHTKTVLTKLATRLEQVSRDLESERLGKLGKLNDAIQTLGASVKNYMMAERIPLSDIRKYACEAFPDGTPFWNTLFNEIRKDLEKLGHPYEGQLASDKELRQDYKGRTGGPIPGPSVTVLNGSHKLYTQFEPTYESVAHAVWARDKKREVDNFIQAVKVSTKVVDTNDDVERVLLYKAAESILQATEDEHDLYELINKLAEEAVVEPTEPAGSDRRRALKAGTALAVGEAGTRYSGAVGKSFAKNFLANKQTGKHPGTVVHQYLRGKNSELL